MRLFVSDPIHVKRAILGSKTLGSPLGAALLFRKTGFNLNNLGLKESEINTVKTCPKLYIAVLSNSQNVGECQAGYKLQKSN